ncbi:MAG: NAD(+)/NADH kinase [bacterium]
MTLGIIANLEKHVVKKIVSDLLEWLHKRQVNVVLEKNLAKHLSRTKGLAQGVNAENFCEQCHMVISFGGDGTMLSTARLVGKSGIPILGVKMGGMGFLAELAPEELYSSLEDILNGHYQIVERMVLEAEIESEEKIKKYYALNDFVLDKGAVSRVIRIKTLIDEEFLNTYIGDGLIISSPTGSTAYSLAAGGPILLPSMEAIIINPISPHSLGARPVVIPGDKVVTVKVESAPNEVMLSADGQIRQVFIQGQSARIQKADFHLKMVSYSGRSFYDVLRAKLNWGEDIRDG